jgi:uncharacterized protein YndB with AHSA1/START domain
MVGQDLPDTIQWRVHFSSPPEKVYDALATDEGRRLFWAEETTQTQDSIRFRFGNGMVFESKVLESKKPVRFAIEYFGGSKVQFELAGDGSGGTDLTMTESGVPETNRLIHLPGWIPVLLSLKAAVDFSIDIRNKDPHRSWDEGYVDV